MFKHSMMITAGLLPAEREAIALPTDLAAVWGSFLHEGLMDSLNTQRESIILQHWHSGCIELMQSVCAVLPRLWTLARDQWQSHSDLGVFEYEVVALLGQYLGDCLIVQNGQLPDEVQIEAVMQRLLHSFYHPVRTVRTAGAR